LQPVRPTSESGDVGDRKRILFAPERLIPSTVTCLLTALIFSRLIFGAKSGASYTDYPAHLRLASKIVNQGELPPHPLFHLAVLVASFGPHPSLFPYAAAFVLALSVAARTYFSIVLWRLGPPTETRSLARVTLVCIALSLAMPLMNWWSQGASFRGQVSPNVWHNPTGIFAMPFALLGFLAGCRALESGRLRDYFATGCALALSALAKPNFVMAFGPVIAIAIVTATRRAPDSNRADPGSETFWAALARSGQARLLASLGPTGAVLCLQYALGFGAGAGSVEIAPFVVWSVFSSVPSLSILLGIAFPLVVVMLYPIGVWRDRVLVLAWATLGIAIAQYALFAETGDRRMHGNFIWGMVAADQVLFVASCGFLLHQHNGPRQDTGFGFLAAHAVAGVVCVLRCLEDPSMAGRY
jgi:hypothetical protein